MRHPFPPHNPEQCAKTPLSHFTVTVSGDRGSTYGSPSLLVNITCIVGDFQHYNLTFYGDEDSDGELVRSNCYLSRKCRDYTADIKLCGWDVKDEAFLARLWNAVSREDRDRIDAACLKLRADLREWQKPEVAAKRAVDRARIFKEVISS